jgi:hypothetical protein
MVSDVSGDGGRERLRYVLTIPVWGESFRALWAEIIAPSYLAPGNLSALKKTGPVDVLLFTRREDATWLAEQRWLRVLAAMAKVEVVHLPPEALVPDLSRTPGEQLQQKYSVHNECVRYVLRRYAGDAGAVMLPLYGDVFWTSGYGEAIAEAMAAGYHAVATASVAVDLDGIRPVLSRLVDQAGPQAFDSRTVIKLGLGHLHSRTLSQIWASGISSENFSYFYWPVGNHGLVCHTMHPVPVAFHLGRIARAGIEFTGSADMTFLFLASPDTANIAVLDDSMNGSCIELVGRADKPAAIRDYPWTPEGLGAELANFRSWGLLFDPATQAKVALTPVRFRHGPVNEEWTQVEAESRSLIQATLDCMKTSATS